MNIQGIGASFSAYQLMSARSSQEVNTSFNSSSAESIMEKDTTSPDGILSVDGPSMSEEMPSGANSGSPFSLEDFEQMLSNGPPPMTGGSGGMGSSGGGGSISSETSSQSSLEFSPLDTNEDGVISYEELEAAQVIQGENMNNKQGLVSNQAINAYQQVMESLTAEFASADDAYFNFNNSIQIMA